VPALRRHDVRDELGAEKLLAGTRRPSASFAGADIVALGAMEAIAEAGLSIAGYDNSAPASFDPISLTSADQDGRQAGANAARWSSTASPHGTAGRPR
jgi:LacI family transcriptional regulator